MAYINAFEQPGLAITMTPATSFADKRYTFVTAGTGGALVAATAAGTACGVLQTPGIAGEPCKVMVTGVSFVALGGTVAPGDEVEVDAAGKAVKKSAGVSCGICLVGGDAGMTGSILLK